MSSRTFTLEMIAPDQAPPPQAVASLNVPAENGRLTVLARHQPIVCALRPGTITVTDAKGEARAWQIGAGVLTVQDNRATLLVREFRPA
jgi:F-type H+-transporting ATPase subunit epsilon